jgi:hypothetical protein
MPEISPAAMKFLRQRVNLRHLQNRLSHKLPSNDGHF